MNIDITDVSAWAVVKVKVNLKPGTAPDMKVSYQDRMMQPDCVMVEYRLDPARGWWTADHITVVGARLLKPAPDGTPRIGKDRPKSTYGGWNRDVQEEYDLPEWLDNLVSELRPNGNVTLPGVG